MWSNLLHIPWRSSRETSPGREKSSIGDPGSAASLAGGFTRHRGRHIYTHQSEISLVRFLPDGESVVIGGTDGTIQRCELGAERDPVEAGSLVHSEEGVEMWALSKDGRWIILLGTERRRIVVWDLTTRQRVIESAEAHEQKITALDVSLDASKIASGSQDGTVIIWCLETGQRFAGPFQQGKSVLSVQFSPQGNRLASVGWGFSIYVWNISNGNNQSMICIPTDQAYSLAWSNDGCRLFTGCRLGSIICFETSTLGVSKWRGHSHSDSISVLRLSNNGKFIVSASRSECYVKIWDAHTHSELGSLDHLDGVLEVEVSPDDRRLVTGTKDGKIYVWDLQRVLSTPYFFYSITSPLALASCSDSRRVLMEVSNGACVSWKRANLARAEQLLSFEIGCGSGPLHYHLASRALVRARLKQWDEAFDDAQSSLLVESSLVARLATSIAQSGQGHHSIATATLDHALESCDQEENRLIHVVKSIILFDAGHHDEAICYIGDLVVTFPDIEQPCAIVQVKMYFFLAEDAMNSCEYIKAISLFSQARDICPSDQCPEMDAISLISGWVFDGLRLAIYRQLCEAYHATGCTQETLRTLQEMERDFRDEIKLRRELHGWLTSFKHRCVEMLESHGDLAMGNKDYDSAVAQYSTALGILPTTPRASALFLKRSEARAALCVWQDALRDADEAVRLNPSLPLGYEKRHAALHGLGRYGDAIEALKALISILENSPDPEIRQLRSNYVDPSNTIKAVMNAVADSVRDSPFRLIDTTSGLLCDAEKRKDIFTEDPVFYEVVSSMTTHLHQERIDAATKHFFQYVMLSHRWEVSELGLADVLNKSVYDLDASPAATKLQGFCHLARDAKFRWAWSDTCCINKDKDVEFERSINSMFRWYRCSAATLVHLAGVPPLLISGALKESIWMTRGWTLQELLAPRVIRFYYEDWTPYLNNTSTNHKESADMLRELEDATGISAGDLTDFHPGLENVAVKLRLASTRETTVPVDMAYGLFGIFDTEMPVIHGESREHALGRLFQEIVARSGDVACLAWVGQSSEFNSTFPSHLRVYEHPSHTVPRTEKEEMEKWAANLRRAWTHEEEAQAMVFHQRLSNMPAAHCSNQHLYLPCIVFPLTTLKKVNQANGTRIYRATANLLVDTDIYSEAKFLPRGQGPEDLVLVCPWIDELLGATPSRHRCRHRRSSVEATRPSSSGSDSEADSEVSRDTSTEGFTVISRGASMTSTGSRSNSGLSSSHGSPQSSTQADTPLKVAVRFRQPLGALLLLALGRGQYKRVATNHEIVIHVGDEVFLDDMDLRTLEVR